MNFRAGLNTKSFVSDASWWRYGVTETLQETVSWSLDLVNIVIFFKVYQGWPPMNCQEIPTKLIWKCKEPCEGWKVTFLKSCVLLLLWPSYVAGDFDQEEKLAATANDASFWHQTFAKMFLSMIHVSYKNPKVILEVIPIVNHLNLQLDTHIDCRHTSHLHVVTEYEFLDYSVV